MAASLTEAQVELINSLAPDDIPIKLRCAICSKLAVNAYRLPCCEQAICESCHSNLPDACPICEHSPLSADDCNPHKSLRTTIKVFIRTAEKKREAARAQEAKASAPNTPVETRKPSVSGSVATEAPPAESTEQVAKPEEDNAVAVAPGDAPVEPPDATQAEQMQGDVRSKTESPEQGDMQPEDGQQVAEIPADGQGAADETTEVVDEQEGEENTESVNGAYANMNYGGGSGDFNQMQMMMAMQNGMNPNAFGGFPMMGMPGMNMDPMQMQNMYMNGGFQGMGMNGMGGFGGGYGQGSNNWNSGGGSQQWNFDQNNYNQNGAGMGAGDFGTFNSSGFQQQQSGYANNQGNYGHFNDYRRGGYGRGRGRGRGFYGGGYGRGGYQQYGGGNGPYQEQGRFQHQQHHGQGQAGYQQHQTEQSGDQQVDELGRDVPREVQDTKDDEAAQSSNAVASHEAAPGTNGPAPIPSVLSETAPAAPNVPLNAPTGPKAMRQGLPNTSLHNLRARGFSIGGNGSQRSQSGSRPHTPLPAQQTTGNDAPKKNDNPADDAYEHDRGRSLSLNPERQDDDQRSRTDRSRTRSREHRSSRRHRRHRDESVGDDGESEYQRKKHRSSKRPSHYYGEEDDEQDSRSREQKPSDRSRSQSASVDESRRSSHRSRRDRDRDRDRRDKDRDRHRDRDRDDDRKKSSHRSHRDRDYESSKRRDRDRDRDREKRKDRERRERHRDEGREERSTADDSRRQSTADDSSAVPQEFKPPTGPRGFDIKGSSSRGASGKDVHTLEREARDRERLLKEAQRMAGMGMSGRRGSAGGSRKRGREDGDEGGGRKSRRSSRRDEGGEEERMRRGEEEREEGRWD